MARKDILRVLVALVSVLVLSVSVMAASMGPMRSKKFFQDEDAVPWAAPHMGAASLKGFLRGDPDGKFRPGDQLKRAEMVAAMVRFANMEEAARAWGNAALAFEDAAAIAENHPWAVGYLGQAAKVGMIPGGGVFRAGEPASRLWAAEVLVKALGLEDEAQSKMGAVLDFADARDIPPDKLGYVAVALEKGILQGYPDGTFKPFKAVTRAELATLLNRADEKRSWLRRFEAEGTVVEVVYGDSPSITLGPDPDIMTFKAVEPRTYKVSPDALVVVDGKKAGLEAVKPGYLARLLLNAEGVAVLVTAKASKEEPEKMLKLRGWLVELPALEGREFYGLIPGNRWGVMKNLAMPKVMAEKAGEFKVLALVPADEKVSAALKANLGKLVVVRGHGLKGPNIYMRPVFKVYEVEPVELGEVEPSQQVPERAK